MYLPPKPPMPELIKCALKYNQTSTTMDYLFKVNHSVTITTGSISILIGLLVIPKIRQIKSYLPSLIVACNIVFGATAVELGLVELANGFGKISP
jgi:hypothetical protein